MIYNKKVSNQEKVIWADGSTFSLFGYQITISKKPVLDKDERINVAMVSSHPTGENIHDGVSKYINSLSKIDRKKFKVIRIYGK